MTRAIFTLQLPVSDERTFVVFIPAAIDFGDQKLSF